MDQKKLETLNKTMKSKGLELYTYDETFIYMFCHLHGFSGLWLKNYNDVGKFINRTPSSIKMQIANVRYMLGERHSSLSDYSEMQEIVYKDIKEMGRYKSFQKIKELINQDVIERKEILKQMGVKNYRKV